MNPAEPTTVHSDTEPDPASTMEGVPAAFPWTAVGALTWMSIRQQWRGRRPLVMALLFLLPMGIVLLVRFSEPSFEDNRRDAEFAVVFLFIPQVLVPLAALLFASGVIQDEVEEQTLPYLLTRPLPRWVIYTSKLLATIVVTSILSGFFSALTLAAIHWNYENLFTFILTRSLILFLLLLLTMCAYCAFFGLLGLLLRRVLVVGVMYIMIFEAIIASFDFVVRRVTVMFYFRVLAERVFDLGRMRPWALTMSETPSIISCIVILATTSICLIAAGAYKFGSTEFRMKTPEGA